ncbi:MAG: DUF6516 family protein [bacterium]
MKDALQSIEEYERFVYSLEERHPGIKVSKLVVIRRGPHHCVLQGRVEFEHEIYLQIYERIDFLDCRIAYYSYEVHQRDAVLFWYDPQPHPNDPALAINHPHHKHIHPDIKHHRIPAPEISFERPNLTFLIEEIVENLL